MAQCKLWHKSNSSGAKSGIQEAIDYVENSLKTTMHNDVDDVIDYATNEEKTNYKLISGINCDPETATEEFIRVKTQYDKFDGYLLWHGEQAFAPGEITPEEAHRLGLELANRMWGDRFQVIVTTHLDKAHIHNHFVFNSVSFVDGKKYNYSNSELWRMRKTNDVICRENGFSVISPKGEGGDKYIEWYEAKNRKISTTKRGMLKQDIDEAIANASSMRNFISVMKSFGYEVRADRKYLAFRYKYDEQGELTYKNRFLRLSSLGKGYSESEISNRILSNRGAVFSAPLKRNDFIVVNMKYKGKFSDMQKRNNISDIILLYVLHIPITHKFKAQYPKCHQATRRDVVKLRQYQEAQLFARRNGIKTVDELSIFKNKLKTEIKEITEERDKLQKRLRKVSDFKTGYEIQMQINDYNNRLSVLRKSVMLCERTLNRYYDSMENLNLINDDKKSHRKENLNEYRKSSNRGNNSDRY